jgi:ubiquitin C-terminal hydrolase
VHLKRFEYKDGKSVKRLDQGELPRKFNNYRLMGFISHIGRNSLSGHYVLYCRRSDSLETWYEFNDEKVFEFKVSHPDEPFERNFKLSNTPYILIYRKQ